MNDFCIEAMTAGRKQPRLYHATVETAWACFGETFWREHMDCRNRIRQQLAPLVRSGVSTQISTVYFTEETASQLRMVTETGFVEPKIAKMVLDPDPEHRRGQQLPNDETIYDGIDLKPTTSSRRSATSRSQGSCCMALFVTALRTCLQRWR